MKATQFKKHPNERSILINYRGRRSQRQMAEMYGVKQQVWCRWEIGTAKPRVQTMMKLERDIGVPMEKIFSDVFNT